MQLTPSIFPHNSELMERTIDGIILSKATILLYKHVNEYYGWSVQVF